MATEKRLIDANELFTTPIPCSRANGKPLTSLWAYVVDQINNAPTVDAVEVVHGRWIEKEYVDEPYGGYYLFHCSECGIPNAQQRNYCPNCGAKMDGDGNG